MGMPLDAWWNNTVSPVFPRTLLNVVTEQSYRLSETNKNKLKHDLDRLDLTVLDYQSLIVSMIEDLNDLSLAFEIGWRIPPTAYGSLGYALVCAPTAGEALELLKRFRHLVVRGVIFTTAEKNDEFSIDFNVIDIIASPMREIVTLTTMASIFRGLELILNRRDFNGELWFSFPKLASSQVITQHVRDVKFNMPSNRITIPASVLSEPLAMYNPDAYQFAIEQCEIQESIQGLENKNMITRVQHELDLGVDGYPTLKDVAEKMHLTPRTLRRRLSQDGANFTELLDMARRRDALSLLGNKNLSIQKISRKLGYSDPANFTRAFRQWTSYTPSEYRNAYHFKRLEAVTS